MTKMLEKAFAEASKLSEIEQNALAKWVLDELEDEKKWDKTFAESESVIDDLAGRALVGANLGKKRFSHS
jgi:hypothetical protein